MECSKCTTRYRELNEVPLCHTEGGCPIQAEATNPHIARLINGYTNYKHLNNSGAPESLQLQALELAGALSLCPDLLVALEPVYYKLKDKAVKEERERLEQEREYREKVSAMKKKAGRKRKR